MGVTLILGALRGLAGRVPAWAWALAAALAWGAIQHHRAGAAARQVLAQQQAAAEAHAQQLQADAAETARRLAAQQEVTTRANEIATQARADAAAARAAAERLRQRIAARQADARPADPAAAGASSPAAAGPDLCPDLLGRAVDHARQLAAVADQSRIAGQACERAYDSLTKD